MPRIVRLICLLAALALSACSVSVQDETPAKFVANPNLALYPITASVTRESMVSPDDVYMTALIDNQSYPLQADRTGNGWHTFYPIRCRDSFQLQYRVAWSVGGLASDSKIVPPKPRTIRLTEPALAADVKFDTRQRSRKGWSGEVQYEFVTELNTQITGVHVEPVGSQPAQVREAADITVVTATPVSAECGKPASIELHSKAQRAQAYLVIDTDNPQVQHWRTKVEFAPAP